MDRHYEKFTDTNLNCILIAVVSVTTTNKGQKLAGTKEEAGETAEEILLVQIRRIFNRHVLSLDAWQ